MPTPTVERHCHAHPGRVLTEDATGDRLFCPEGHAAHWWAVVAPSGVVVAVVCGCAPGEGHMQNEPVERLPASRIHRVAGQIRAAFQAAYRSTPARQAPLAAGAAP